MKNIGGQSHPIKEEWNEYYVALERIRRSGICNMFGAAQPLAVLTNISETLATEILMSWIENYDELNKKFGWQD